MRPEELREAPVVQEPTGGALASPAEIHAQGRLRRILRNQRLRVAIQLAVAGVVLLFVGRALWIEWPQIAAYDWRIEPGYAVLGMALLLARGPIICFGWWAILRQMGYSLPWRTAIRVYFYSGLAKYMPGSLWYAVGRVLLAEQAGVPKMVTSVSIALETALVTGASISVGALALTVQPDVPWWSLAVVLVGLLVFLAWPGPWFALLNWGLRKVGRTTVTITISGRQLLLLLPPFILSWVAYGFISFFWTAALYPQLPWSDWPAITGLYTASWVIGFLTLLVPNGWGVREVLLISGLTHVLGLPVVVATGAAILSRLGSILGEATWALIAWRLKPPAR